MRKRFPWMLVLFGITAGLWAFWPLLLAAWYGQWFHYADDSIQRYGQFGDSYGALNAVFTGIGFIFVAATLFQQMSGLELQRKLVHEELATLENSKKRDAADRVIARWQNLLKSRNLIFHWVNRDRDINKPIPVFPLDFDDPIAAAIIDMINFFEEWGSLERAGGIDTQYIGTVLGFHANWFYWNVFRELSIQVRDRQKSGAKHELVAPLFICWVFVFKKYRYQRTFEGAMNALDEIDTYNPEWVV